MFLYKFRRKISGWHLSLKTKLTLSLSAIAVTLLTSSIISVMEYSKMSSYVSDLIADNINSINMAQGLSEVTNTYNLDILTVIGDESLTRLPDFNQEAFVAHCDSLKKSFKSSSLMPLADSVMYSYSAYLLTSLELQPVMLSDFIDSRTWYFERLQPKFGRLHSDIDKLSEAIYYDLKKNSETFQRGFYRSIIPGIVAVGVGLLLIMMLLFFIVAYYADPLYKMLSELDSYRSYNTKYNYTFEGDDQLSELNNGIMELTSENQQLRKRINSLRSSARENNTDGHES